MKVSILLLRRLYIVIPRFVVGGAAASLPGRRGRRPSRLASEHLSAAAIICSCLLLVGSTALAATHYVDINNATPLSPYTNWVTAATNIQDAVDVAASGDTVVVTNGHYLLSSEIVVTNDITIQSVNGPDSTIVDGQGAVRCFNLGNTACIVSGLTITNGFQGIYCSGTTPVVTNCVISGNGDGSGDGGGMHYGTANNCTFSGNNGYWGGAMRWGEANNCTFRGNRANRGGGMDGGMANNCTFTGNSAGYGGGMDGGIANNCSISGNIAASGGGMYGGTANNCTITGNSAIPSDGGFVPDGGGGMCGGTANNSIVWYNESISGPNLYGTTVNFSCSPDVMHGVDGNITNAPLLVSFSHVATNSPCRGAGDFAYASGTDIDGEAWLDPPSMGCDEYHGTVTGELQVAVMGDITTALTAYSLSFQGVVEGVPGVVVWDFDDGTHETNTIYISHAWSNPGIYAMTLTAYNDTYPSGVTATQTIQVATLENSAVYVAVDGDDANDGSSWAEAKATIQAGVAQAYEGGLGVWISNGIYLVTSEIVVNKKISIQSVNGPESTVVDCQGAVRCFNLGDTVCVVSGLTITNGYTEDNGGGIYCTDATPVVTNCIITGNRADDGGGMYRGTVNNCTFIGNHAFNGGGMSIGTANNCTFTGNNATYGGGMYWSMANNSTIHGNSANYGGGMYRGTANNCLISGNTADDSGGGMYNGTATNCTIRGNSAANNGGGISDSTAHNCTILSNTAANNGGGAHGGTANNCTISGNSAAVGGGMYYGYANNCIVWNNNAPSGPNLESTVARHTCSPDVTHGASGNITNAPLFVSSGNYRLAPNSPCINAGSNGYVTVATDLDGYPRIIDGTVDMGAYEAFYVTNINPIAAGFALEWMSCPTGWNSVVMYSTNLVDMPFTNLSASMPYPANSYTDLLHGAGSECFYTVELQP